VCYLKAATAASDRHHRTVHIVGQPQQQPRGAADAVSLLRLLLLLL
jgi:hypothetical protein